ncbi:MAG: DNA translocase FtsK, partial [Steroidobacteraceae bacterium]
MVGDTIPSDAAANDQTTIDNGGDPLLEEAIWIVASENSASVSLLVDRLKIGGERAAELLRSMQTALIVAPTGPGGSIQILCGLYDTTVRPLVEAAWQGCLDVTAAFRNADQAEIAARINAVWAKYEATVSELCGKLDGEHRRALQVLFERERERQFQEFRA